MIYQLLERIAEIVFVVFLFTVLPTIILSL